MLDAKNVEAGVAETEPQEHVEQCRAEDNSRTLKYHNGILLDPQPSEDPHDPLNFPFWQKASLLAILSYWAFLGTTNLIIVGPSFFELNQHYGASFTELSYTINGPLVAYGAGCLFWVPFSNIYGLRACFLVSSLCAASISIWAALASTFGEFVAARVLAAFFYAAPEAIGPQVVADVFFLHQRATATGAFTVFQFLGFSLAGLIGGFATLNLGWRAPSYVMVYTTFGAFVGIFFLMPETTYTRAGRFEVGEKRRIADGLRLWRASGGGDPKVKSKVAAFTYPWYYLPHPIVLLTTAYFSIFLATNDYMLTTNSVSYPLEFGFSLSDVALTSIAPSLGNIFGIIYGGLANDKFVEWMMKSKGEFQPEMRLPMLLLTAIVGPAGLIMFGCATEYHAHWVIPLIGEFLMAFGSIVAGNVTYTYIADTYLERADTALVMLNGLKNLSAFGLVYAVTPWNTYSGYAISFGGLAVILFAFHLPIVILWWKGAAIRQWQQVRWHSATVAVHGEGFK
ncbi:hypothetical protein RBB50_002165 [Rhinocladiella similis]